MMQAGQSESVEEKAAANRTPSPDEEALDSALQAIAHFNLEIEVCGTWIWVYGDTQPYRTALMAAGYRWSPRKMCWYFRPESCRSHNRAPWSRRKIQEAYGRTIIKEEV